MTGPDDLSLTVREPGNTYEELSLRQALPTDEIKAGSDERDRKMFRHTV
jgi:hypothetical protein